MARQTVEVTVIKCDGCGEEMPERANNWGTGQTLVSAKPMDYGSLSLFTSASVHGRAEPADVCARCMASLLRDAIMCVGEVP